MKSRALGLALTFVLASAAGAPAWGECFERQAVTCGGLRTIRFAHILAADRNRPRLKEGERFELSPMRALEIAAAELRRAPHLGKSLWIEGVSSTQESCGGQSVRFYTVAFYSELHCTESDLQPPYYGTGNQSGYVAVLMNGKALLPQLEDGWSDPGQAEWAARRLSTRGILERAEEAVGRELRSLGRQARGLASGLKCSLLDCPAEEDLWWFPRRAEWPQLLPEKARALAARKLRGIMDTTKDGVLGDVQLRRGDPPGGWYYYVSFVYRSRKPCRGKPLLCFDFAAVEVFMTGDSKVYDVRFGCSICPQ